MRTGWEAGVRDVSRVAAVKRSGLVGMGPEAALDSLLELAVVLTGAPRACISLVDAERTTALSSVGFPQDSPLSAPNPFSLCRFVVSARQPLVVSDTRRDPRTAGDAAIDAFDAAAWAGYAIEDPDGAVLGTLCVMDVVPHVWTARDLLVLSTLARAVSTEIALRQTRDQLRATQWEIEALRAAGTG